jgi:uncharacterized membrane protein
VTKARVAVAAIVLAALALRLYAIGAKPLWYDEIGTVARLDGRFGFATVPAGVVVPKVPTRVGFETGLFEARNDVHPPLFFLLLHAWREAFGAAPGAMRALSALAAAITVAAGAGLAWTRAAARGGPGPGAEAVRARRVLRDGLDAGARAGRGGERRC